MCVGKVVVLALSGTVDRPSSRWPLMDGGASLTKRDDVGWGCITLTAFLDSEAWTQNFGER